MAVRVLTLYQGEETLVVEAAEEFTLTVGNPDMEAIFTFDLNNVNRLINALKIGKEILENENHRFC